MFVEEFKHLKISYLDYRLQNPSNAGPINPISSSGQVSTGGTSTATGSSSGVNPASNPPRLVKLKSGRQRMQPPTQPPPPFQPPKASRTHVLTQKDIFCSGSGRRRNNPCDICYQRNKSQGMKAVDAQRTATTSTKYCPQCDPDHYMCDKCFEEIHVLD